MKANGIRRVLICAAASALLVHGSDHAGAATGDIVLTAGNATKLQGNWARVSDGSAAGGQMIASSDRGWATADSALASPNDYIEYTFSASAGTPYHVWLRLRAASNSKYNDSVYVQFSDSVDANGSSLYRLWTTSALAVNLQTCSGCALSGWGWVDGAYWLDEQSTVRFATTGSHTIRVQTREDGVQVDQIVISASTYLNNPPGRATNDTTILGTSSTTTASATTGLSPYGGTAAAVPGTIHAERFDNGGEGVAYHDTTSGNSGGAFRSGGVDIEASAAGGYDIGWIAAGEWLNYTVNVASAGSYTLQLRVASPTGAKMHVGFNKASDVWTGVAVPATGGWQNWSTVNVPVTLGAGTQQMTIMFDTTGLNYASATISGGSTSTSGATVSGPYGGTPVSIPGRIQAENFDNGPEGTAYHDTTSGNSGGVYRSTGVDLEPSADGGYDIGWIAAGEWTNYTVNVTSSGSYTAQIRVASPSGGRLHIGFNGPSSVWTAVTIPASGGWQTWTTVNVPVSLGAGQQQMTLLFDTGGYNISYVNVVSGSTSTSSGSTGSSSGSTSGTLVPVIEWNIRINDGSESHARLAMDMALAAGPRAKVVVIEEAYLTWFNTYIDELQRQTGQTWYGAFATHCAPGNWNGSSCTAQWYQGVGIFSTYRITSTSSTFFPYADCWTSARAGLRAALDVNGVTTQVFATHLQTGGCANDAQSRYNSMSKLKSWASNYAAPRLAAGDFNADPDQIDTTSGMLPTFVDSWWAVGSGSKFTAFVSSPTMKIDYWFADTSGRAVAQSSQVVLSTGSVSDHYPVQATFLIK